MRVVLDTNIYISATFWQGDSYHIIRKIFDNKIEAFISQEITKEIRRVLKRDFELSEQEIFDVITSYQMIANEIEPTEKITHILEDPDDDRILECAQSCRADFIITQDKHLLRIRKFRKIPIISPKDFLIQNH